jgi:hypothetical protein
MNTDTEVRLKEPLADSSEAESQVIDVDDPRVTIRVENYLPDDLLTHYSDGLIVVHTENEFAISFLQTQFPLAATKEELQEVEVLKRKCVAQVIVSPQQMEKVVEALQENLKKFTDAYRTPMVSDEN